MSDSPGTRLRAAREARQLSVDDITSVTNMRPAIIQALEADDYTKFPSITHARSFLSLYGKFLKVDVKDGLALLAKPKKISVENYQYLNVVRHDDASFRTQRRHSISHPGNAQNPRTLGIIALVLLGLFLAGYLVINLRRLNLATSAPSTGAPAAETTPAPTATPAPSLPPLAAPTPSTTPFHPPLRSDRRLIRTPTPTPFE